MGSYHQDDRYIGAMGAYLSGDWNAAEEAFEMLDRSFPDEAYIKLLRGNISYSQGRLDEAVERYHQAISAQHNFGNAHYKLGVCLYRMGRLQEARRAFQAVVDMGSQSHAMALYFVGLISLFLGEDETAVTAFSDFREQSPTSHISKFYLAQLYLKQKKYEQMVPLFKRTG